MTKTTVPARGLVLTGAGIATLLGLVVLVIRLVTADPTQLSASILAGLALAALQVVPAALAVQALRTGHRQLLAVAVGLLIVGSIPMFTLVPIALLTLVLWAQAWSRWPTPGPRRIPAVAWLALLAAVGAVVALFVHADPYCWQQTRTTDGSTTARAVEPDSPSGFRWTMGSTTTSGSATSPASGDIVATGCSSDQIVPAESLASLLLIGAAAFAATRLGDTSQRPAPTETTRRTDDNSL